MRTLIARTLLAATSLWLIVTVGFVCVYKLPGDPARMVLGRQASLEALQEFRAKAGLDEPLWRQYARFLDRTVHLDFGNSLLYRRPVIDLIHERMIMTAKLVSFSLVAVVIIAFVLPLLLRLLSADRCSQWLSGTSMVIGVAPPYVLGVVILTLLAGQLGWVSPIFEPGKVAAWILPSLVLAAYPTTITMRLFENQLAHELGQQYVVRARAMGFRSGPILLREVVPNAMTAALASLANGLAAFITGTFFVEVIFGISGLGRLTYEAIANKDIALLAALCIVFAFAITAVSNILYLAQLLIDPRLRDSHA